MVDKEELEKQKLKAEIDEIKFRNKENEERTAKDKKKFLWLIPHGILRRLPTSLPLIITIISGIIAMLIQVSVFQNQRARAYEVVISDKMIALVEKLNPDLTKEQKAAMLLSGYEKDAIPLLLMNLEVTKTPKATINSLIAIKEKKKVKPEEVIIPLIKSAENIFNSNEVTDENHWAFENYIEALGTLGTEKKEQIKPMLDNLKTRLQTGTDLKSKNKYSFLIKKAIQNALDILNGDRVSTSQD